MIPKIDDLSGIAYPHKRYRLNVQGGAMVIGSASQLGDSVRVYSEQGKLLFVRSGSLMGYTSSSVTIRFGNAATTYDERGSQRFVRSA